MRYLITYLCYGDVATEEYTDLGEALGFIQENINGDSMQFFQLYKEIPLDFKVEIK